MSWLGPVGVRGPFDVPFRVLAFDDSGQRPGTPFGVEASGKEGDRCSPEPGDLVLRGKSRPVGLECGTVFAEGIKQQLVSDTPLELHWAFDSSTLSEDAHDYTTTRYTPQHTSSNGLRSETQCGLCTLS